jgi:hypothetical protein
MQPEVPSNIVGRPASSPSTQLCKPEIAGFEPGSLH